jgi:hypothetical protein
MSDHLLVLSRGKRPAVLGGSSSAEQILTGSQNIQKIGLIQSYGYKNK